MPKKLSEDQIAAYRRDGFCFPVDLLSETEVKAARGRMEALETKHGRENLKLYLKEGPHYVFRFASELARHPRVLDAVEDLIGPDVLLWSSAIWIKEAGDGRFVSWHQDGRYWGLEPVDGISVWIALSPATEDSGAMRMVPGSHLGPIVEHVDTYGQGNMLTRGQTIPGVDEGKAVTIALRPGQMSLHAMGTFHGSSPNRSADRRIGFSAQYVPPHMHQVVGQRDYAILVRGEDRFGNFELREPTTRDLAPEDTAFHTRMLGQMDEVLYKGAQRRRV